MRIFNPGYRFPKTKLTFVREIERRGGLRMFVCRCDCGNEVITSRSHLSFSGNGKPHTKMCRKCSYEKRGKTRIMNGGHKILSFSSFKRMCGSFIRRFPGCSKKDFQKEHPYEAYVATKKRWFREIQFPGSPKHYTNGQILEIASKFDSISEFAEKFNSLYVISRKRNMKLPFERKETDMTYLEKRKIPIGHIRRRLSKRNIEIVDEENYTGFLKSRNTFRCMKCGYVWKTTIQKILTDGSGCRRCNGNRLKIFPGERYGSFEVICELTPSKCGSRRFSCVCTECGKKTVTTADNLVRGSKRKCDGCILKEQMSDRLDFSYERLSKKLEKRHSRLYTKRKDYGGLDSEVEIRCVTCGRRFKAKLHTLDFGRTLMCEDCLSENIGIRSRLSWKDVCRRFSDLGLHLVSKEREYRNNCSKLRYMCKSCGKVIVGDLATVSMGDRHYCSVCSGKMSHFERKTLDILSKIFRGYEIESQYSGKQHSIMTYNGKLGKMTHQYFDFYIPELNLAIEANGGFHYTNVKSKNVSFNNMVIEQQERDRRKRKYCRRNGIKLVELDCRKFKKYSKLTEEFVVGELNRNGIHTRTIITKESR